MNQSNGSWLEGVLRCVSRGIHPRGPRKDIFFVNEEFTEFPARISVSDYSNFGDALQLIEKLTHVESWR